MDPKENVKQGGAAESSATTTASTPEISSVKDTTTEAPVTTTETPAVSTDVKPQSDDEAKKKKKMMIVLLVILLLLLGLLSYIGYQMYQQSQEDDNPTIVVDVEDDEDEVGEDTADEDTDETTDEDTGDEDSETPPDSNSDPVTYDYEEEYYMYGNGDGDTVTSIITVKFQSSLSNLAVLERGDGDPIPEVGMLLMGSGDFKLQFSNYYEGFTTRYEESQLTSVGNNSQIGVIHRLPSNNNSLLATMYVSDVQMTGQCMILGEYYPAPCGPQALTLDTGEWVWMSCAGDPDSAYCDEIVKNLEITFDPVAGVNPL